MHLSEFAYTVLLRPKPLRALANAVICRLIPPQLSLNGAVVVLNQRDPVVSGALALGLYERAETAFFRAARQPGMTFLDIGANIGYFSALALEVLEGGRIIALEPDPENFRFLKQTIAANRARNVICVNKAAADRNGMLTLHTRLTGVGAPPPFGTSVEQSAVADTLSPASVSVTAADNGGRPASAVSESLMSNVSVPLSVFSVRLARLPVKVVNAPSCATAGATFDNWLLPTATLSSSLFSSRSFGDSNAAIATGAPDAGSDWPLRR